MALYRIESALITDEMARLGLSRPVADGGAIINAARRLVESEKAESVLVEKVRCSSLTTEQIESGKAILLSSDPLIRVTPY